MNFDFLSDPQYDILGAFWVTIELTILAAIGSLIWGTILAGMRVSPVPIMRWFGTGLTRMPARIVPQISDPIAARIVSSMVTQKAPRMSYWGSERKSKFIAHPSSTAAKAGR